MSSFLALSEIADDRSRSRGQSRRRATQSQFHGWRMPSHGVVLIHRNDRMSTTHHFASIMAAMRSVMMRYASTKAVMHCVLRAETCAIIPTSRPLPYKLQQ
jgi:hypothetical protein